jgi:DNA-binding GntR family transcriptional regulator
MIEQTSRCRQSAHSRAALTVLLIRSCRTASLRKQSMSGEAQLVQVAGLEPAEPATTISVPGTAPLTVDAIFRLLRDEILHGVLPPGAVVSQVKLAERLGINRTPLREALRMLQRENLIEGEHNRRIRVTNLTSEDLVDLYALRISEESIAIRLTVPQLTQAELDEIEHLLDEMAALESAETLAEWEQHHRKFHRILVSHAGTRITRSVNDLQDYCERYRRALLQRSPISFTIGAREHRAIAEACAAGDQTAAAVALARHLGRTALTLVSVTDPSYDPRPVREVLRLVCGDTPPPTPLVPDQ